MADISKRVGEIKKKSMQSGRITETGGEGFNSQLTPKEMMDISGICDRGDEEI